MSIHRRPPPLHFVMEAARVAAVESYAILDTPPDSRFDDLAKTAATETSASAAFISFLDRDRQWIKARFGSEMREMPRHLSFCHHTLHDPSGVLVVPDTLADPRFSHHPKVQGPPYFRFYAGVSLTDRDGYRLGTVSVLDCLPRSLYTARIGVLHWVSLAVVDSLSNARPTPPKNETAMPVTASGSARPVIAPSDAVLPIQGWLGIRTRRAAPSHGTEPHGLLVISVAQGSPAEKAGLTVGDVLLSVGTCLTKASADIANALKGRFTGEAVNLRLWRADQVMQCEILVELGPSMLRVHRRAH